MKTDSILEELYQVRADMIKQAGHNFDTLFGQLRERHQSFEAQHPEIKWVDFSGQTATHAARAAAPAASHA